MNLKKTTAHGLTECGSSDAKEQAECEHNPQIPRSDKSKHCYNFRWFGDGYFVCNNIDEGKNDTKSPTKTI